MGFLNELNIPYDVKNITTNPAYVREVEAVSGQSKSPTLNMMVKSCRMPASKKWRKR